METPPQTVIQEITRDTNNFLWIYKKIRINRTTVTMPIKEGGLGIIDIETQFKAIKCAIVLSNHLEDEGFVKLCCQSVISGRFIIF